MWPNPKETTDLVTFTVEILNGDFIFFAVKNDSSNDVRAAGFVCYVRALCNGFEV